MPEIPTSNALRRASAGRAGFLLAAVALAAIGGCAGSHNGNDTAAPIDHPKTVKAPPPIAIKWGTAKGIEPHGVVILLHGGGWQPNPAGYKSEIALGRAVQAGGFATVAVAYGPGAVGFRQIENVYAAARHRYPTLPICASGNSAGGNLALMLATREPGLACVIDIAGPTDLTTLLDQGSTVGYQYAVDAFGADGLASFSPVRYAHAIKAKVLMIFAQDDPYSPPAQGEELQQALPSAKLIVLPAGTAPFVHGPGVDPQALANATQQQEALLASIAAP